MNFVIPSGFYGRIVGRSGLTILRGIVAFNGTIDADWGTVYVILFNLSDFEYDIKVGNWIAELIIKNVLMLSLLSIMNWLIQSVL